MIASINGLDESVKILLSYGVDINLQDVDGDTALILSCRWNRKKCVKLLCESGADINIKNYYGCYALVVSYYHSCIECIKILSMYLYNLELNFDHHIIDNDTIKFFIPIIIKNKSYGKHYKIKLIPYLYDKNKELRKVR